MIKKKGEMGRQTWVTSRKQQLMIKSNKQKVTSFSEVLCNKDFLIFFMAVSPINWPPKAATFVRLTWNLARFFRKNWYFSVAGAVVWSHLFGCTRIFQSSYFVTKRHWISRKRCWQIITSQRQITDCNLCDAFVH